MEKRAACDGAWRVRWEKVTLTGLAARAVLRFHEARTPFHRDNPDMFMATLARRAAKTLLFVALFCVFARVIDASRFISLETANAFARWLHGSANQENYDDLWFFTDLMASALCAIIAWRAMMGVWSWIAASRKRLA
ncbi:hypothetical protein [Cronobacter dublinensis]|uniref:hypothetical protein n=2 Tax=Cronobacter dublinensis TaxID=413497 RepID=UPI001FB57A0F|nr:hypothetical protein [Cronobacter dublinensis]